MTQIAPTRAVNSSAAIEARGLRKSFGKQLVLDDIDLWVPEGSVFALLGPNGSGKTTTVHILTTLLAPDAGSMRVAGYDVVRQADLVRRAIGVTGQFSAVDDLLTGRENLQLMGDLAHVRGPRRNERVDELLARFDLAASADKLVHLYSGGMRRRLDLAMTMLGEPRIVFLDEPTTGLDPRSRLTMWQVVEELTRDGVSIFLTTQQLDEADRLASRVALLDKTHIVAEGTPSELKRLVPGGQVELSFANSAALEEAVRSLDGTGCTVDRSTLSIRMPTDGRPASLRAALGKLDDGAVPVESVSVRTADLDDVFFSLTGRPQPEAGEPSTTRGI